MDPSVIQQLESDTKLDVRGFRCTKTHTGQPLDVLKSALQKYIRRCDVDGGIWCAKEAFLFRTIGEYTSTSKAALTNVINRIQTVLLEDVSFRECEVTIYVSHCIDEYEKSNRLDPYALCNAFRVLAMATKLRVGSHANAHFSNMLMDPVLCSSSVLEEMKSVFDRNLDFETAREEIVKLTVFMYRFWDKKQKRNALDQFWKLLEHHCTAHTKAVEALRWRRAFFEGRSFFREQHVVLITSALLTVYCRFYVADAVDLNPSNFAPQQLSELSLDWNKHKLLEHPPYVYDIHTKSGLKENKTHKYFFEVSSLVNNEDELMKVDSWFNSYRQMKLQRQDHTRIHQSNCSSSPVKKRSKVSSSVSKSFKGNLPQLEADLPLLHIADLNTIRTPEDGKARSKKVPCLFVDGKVIKEMRRSFSYGRHQACVQKLKVSFGIPKVSASRMLCHIVFDPVQGCCVLTNENVVYFVMDEITDSPKPSSHLKDLIEQGRHLQKLLCKIVIFRVLLGVSDTNMTNILIPTTSEATLYSIDENFMGSKALERSNLTKLTNYIFKFLKKDCKLPACEYEDCFAEVWGEDVRQKRLETIREQMQAHQLDEELFLVIQKNGELLKSVCDRAFYKRNTDRL